MASNAAKAGVNPVVSSNPKASITKTPFVFNGRPRGMADDTILLKMVATRKL
jgi:hypothetical protein